MMKSDEKIIRKCWKIHKYAKFEEMTGNWNGNGNEDESDKHI